MQGALTVSVSYEDATSQLEAARASREAHDWDALALAIPPWTPNSDESRQHIAEWEDGIHFLTGCLEAVLRVGALDASAGKVATAVAHLFAEAAKSEDAREPIAEAGAIPLLLDLLGKAAPSFGSANNDASPEKRAQAIQALRALANLCYDHDDNRERVLETPQGIPHLVVGLGSSNIEVVITTCGALTNISMDNEPVQTAILDLRVLPVLMDIIKKTIEIPLDHGATISAATPAIRVISNLSECERGVHELLATNSLAVLLQLLRYKHDVILRASVSADRFAGAVEVLDALTTVLEAIGENDAIQRAIVSNNLLEHLLDFVDHRPQAKPLDVDEDDLLTYLEVRKAVSRTATLVTMNDANMLDITQKGATIERFKQWTLNGTGGTDVVEEDEIRMSGALAIGNLARSDSTCIALVQKHGVAPALLDLLQLEIQRAKEPNVEGKGIIKVVHAVIGALKNLSLAAANREMLGSLGVIAKVAEVLEVQAVKPVHYMSIGILKNLCAGSQAVEANVYRLIAGQEPPQDGSLATWPAPANGFKTPLSKVVSLMWTATGDNDTGTRNEGGRLIVNLVRACHRGRATQLMRTIVDAQGIVLLIQIVTGALLTRPRTTPMDAQTGAETSEEEHHVHFDALPVEGQVFPMVQNEGIIALVLVTDAIPESVAIITRYHASLIPTMVKILSSGIRPVADGEEPPHVYADEVKANVCTLLRALVGSDDAFKDRLDQASLKSTLQTLRQSTTSSPTSPTLQQVSQSSPTSTTSTTSATSTTSPTNNSNNNNNSAPFSTVATPMELSRTGTKSARKLGLQGPSQRELSRAFAEPGSNEHVMEGVPLRDAVAGLLLLL
ncbi:hypothetical protein PhCBS80983_g04062 [Powellomyces hirtus]|uniref:Armadillo repeat-containing domain-containing protein n=1 Tax=Powellomyces hirtus TaxID=109895 RepID=A0A507E1Y1_9FUNG|nr:hypothetical protein PhCBS80983_g04062 [Powellomyces hirtus]